MLAVGGHVAVYHRIIDAHGREHKVLTAAEAFLDAGGQLRSVAGVTLDLTATVHEETVTAAQEAILGAMGTRCVITQAQGILMGRIGITSEEAFEILRIYSNNANIKLADVALTLVTLAEQAKDPAPLENYLQVLRTGGRSCQKNSTKP